MPSTSPRVTAPQASLTPEQIEQILQRNQELEAAAATVAVEKAQIEQERAILDAKRAAAVQEVENDSMTIRDEKREADDTDRALAKQKKFRVFIPDDPRLIDPKKPSKKQTHTVQINGASKYVVTCGEDQEVPESVYLVLVEAGLIRPQRTEDVGHYPRVSVKPNAAAGILG